MKDPTAAESLRQSQNADGGWGFFPGKQSWLEPTFYAAVALEGEPAADRAWGLLKSWQRPDGAWRPSADVQVASWGTALCVRLAQARGEFGEPFQKGVSWLLSTAGNEGPLWWRALLHTGLVGTSDRNLSYRGWPWKPDAASWVEPTVHAILALKHAAPKIPSEKLRERVHIGEEHLLDVRCSDHGWNCGNRSAMQIDLVAYPETTGLALLALQGQPDLGKSIDLAVKMAGDTISPLARLWLTIALRVYGVQVPPPAKVVSSPETVMAALSILAEDKISFFRTGAAT